VFFDKADGPRCAQRADTVLDERGQASVMALDQLDDARLRPRAELAAKIGVVDERLAHALEAVGDPRDDLRIRSAKIRREHLPDRRRGFLGEPADLGARERLDLQRLYPRDEPGVGP